MKNMKKLSLLILSFTLFFGVSQVFSQTTEVPQEIISALNDGNASTLSSFFGNNVELVVENRNDIFSKQQASGIIADFFRRNPINGFTVLHKGVKEASSFVIGTLRTSNGAFRVYVLTRKSGNDDVIQQLRIESSNE
jgi:hypothetical protein